MPIFVNHIKKYIVNFNMPSYNASTGLYEDNDSKYQSYSEARSHKWKCEKCSQTYPSYKLLCEHKTELHSY